MPSTESATRRLQDRAILWTIGEARAADVVNAACDALVAGLDSPALRALAARTRAEADYDVPELLPSALEELGVVLSEAGFPAGKEAAARALARQVLTCELTPRELAFRIHRHFGHELPLAERLAELDDEYDILEYGERTPAQIDAEVMEEARRLAQHPGPALELTADAPT